jgi:ubiquinone/menaquinone biosynthesis methyltransferase
MPLNVYCITEVLPLINKKKQSNQESIVTNKKMMPKKLHDLDFSNPEEKRSYNRDLFREVSRKYDTITKVLSFGRDKAWKRLLIKKLPDMASPLCLDLACGTGDITRALSARYPDGKVTGLDLTREMLDKAEMYGIPGNVTYIEGDMNNIEKKDGFYDIISGGYALRNAPHIPTTLKEIARVCKTGGTAAFLDFSKSSNRVVQALSLFILKTWGSFWGLVYHGNADIYGYLGDSLKAYPDRKTLREMIGESGFTLIYSKRFFFGMLELVILSK